MAGQDDALLQQALALSLQATPNPEQADATTKTLVEMGFSENAARRALHKTHYAGLEAAITWLDEHSVDPDLNAAFDPTEETTDAKEKKLPPTQSQRSKMVMVVNTGLKMTPGKIAAQCCHACLAVYQECVERDDVIPYLDAWEEGGEMKIVLQAPDAATLEALEKRAEELALPCYLVQDAGRTQVAPGSQTVFGVFGPVDLVDQVTGKLRLYP